MIGRRHRKPQIQTLALDRINNIEFDLSIEYECRNFAPDQYYKNTYGVSLLGDDDLIEIIMQIDKFNAPFVITKPFHSSQKLIRENEDGSIIIYLKVHHNFEIERLILGFGESIEILQPIKLRNSIKIKLEKALSNYYQKDVII